jgi:hypothetical protein
VRVDKKILRGYKIFLYKIIKNIFEKIYFYKIYKYFSFYYFIIHILKGLTVYFTILDKNYTFLEDFFQKWKKNVFFQPVFNLFYYHISNINCIG